MYLILFFYAKKIFLDEWFLNAFHKKVSEKAPEKLAYSKNVHVLEGSFLICCTVLELARVFGGFSAKWNELLVYFAGLIN